MGLFGGDSSSTSVANYSTDTRNANVQGVEGLALANSSRNRIYVSKLDGGAIKEAFSLGGKAVEGSQRLAESVVTQGGRNLGQILGFADAVINRTGAQSQQVMRSSVEQIRSAFEDARSSSQEDVLKIGLLLIGGVTVAAMVYRK